MFADTMIERKGGGGGARERLLASYHCITNYHKYSHLKQCTFIISQCPRVRNLGGNA